MTYTPLVHGSFREDMFHMQGTEDLYGKYGGIQWQAMLSHVPE